MPQGAISNAAPAYPEHQQIFAGRKLGLAKALGLLFGVFLPTVAGAQAVPQWQVREELRLGESLTQAVNFSRVVAIVPRPDGSFFVADAAEKSLRFFSRDGQLLKVIGREGAGPGEFRALAAAGIWADTLWVLDPQLRRVSLFSTAGDFLRVLNAPTVAGSPATLRSIVDSGLIVQTSTFVSTTGTNHGSDNAVVRVSRTDRSADTIATLKFGVGDWLHRQGGTTPFSVILPNPFNDGSLFDSDSKGGNLTVVHREVKNSRLPEFEVLRIDASAKTLWSRRFVYTPQPIPSSVKDSVARARGVGANARFPDHMPPVSRVVAGEDGTVWLRREEHRPNRLSEWNVLDSSGRMIGRFETRRPFQLHAATAQSILVVIEDEDDVPLVVRYAIMPVR